MRLPGRTIAGERRINTRSATLMPAVISSHPVAYIFFEPLGTPSPVPWDFSLYARSMIKGVGDAVRTSPMPLGRRGARVASQQSSILHNGAYSLTMTRISSKSQRATISAAYDETPRRDFGSPGTCRKLLYLSCESAIMIELTCQGLALPSEPGRAGLTLLVTS